MCAVVSGCATVKQPQARSPIQVIAHRGASAYAPENTMAAFRLAHEMGADWFELDCTLTKDGEVLVIHDDTVDRTTPAEGHVWDMELAELQTLDAGSWKDARFAAERLPTLDETLDFAKGRLGVYIEVKGSDDDRELESKILALAENHPTLTPDLTKKMMTLIEESGSRNLALSRRVIELVRERGMSGEVVVQSFSPIVCAVVRVEAPELRVEFLSGTKADDYAAFEQKLRWAYLLGVDGFNTNVEAVTPGRLALLHGSGKTVAVWTVNSKPEWRRLAGWGVDALITDRPDACMETLEEIGKR